MPVSMMGWVRLGPEILGWVGFWKSDPWPTLWWSLLLINRPHEDWKAELALLADLQRMVYHRLPISCRSSADQWKFAGQRPTFYHWATQPINHPQNLVQFRKGLRIQWCFKTSTLKTKTRPRHHIANIRATFMDNVQKIALTIYVTMT